MAKRPEVIQKIADLLGDSFVTMENHARSMGSASDRYSTKIGRGNRDVDLSPDWIASSYLAAVCNDPKHASIKVPELGNLKGGAVGQVIRRSVQREGNLLIAPRITETVRSRPTLSAAPYATLFDLISDLIGKTGRWLSEGGEDSKCPIHSGFRIVVTLAPVFKATVSFDLVDEQTPSDQVSVEYSYFQSTKRSPHSKESQAIPLERNVVIPLSHILRLGSIYANSSVKPKNEKADNLPGSSASSETTPHRNPRSKTDTTRRKAQPLSKANPTARVCLPSSEIEIPSSRRRRTHDPASYQHTLSLA